MLIEISWEIGTGTMMMSEIDDATFEIIDSTEEQYRVLVESIGARLQRIRDGNKESSTSEYAFWG